MALFLAFRRDRAILLFSYYKFWPNYTVFIVDFLQVIMFPVSKNNNIN